MSHALKPDPDGNTLGYTLFLVVVILLLIFSIPRTAKSAEYPYWCIDFDDQQHVELVCDTEKWWIPCDCAEGYSKYVPTPQIELPAPPISASPS